VPFCHLHEAPRREQWEVKINRHISLHKACDQGLASSLIKQDPESRRDKEASVLLSLFFHHGTS